MRAKPYFTVGEASGSLLSFVDGFKLEDGCGEAAGLRRRRFSCECGTSLTGMGMAYVSEDSCVQPIGQSRIVISSPAPK
jgi:hypothetical protein